ncbi:MAG: site-specific DNA-methyltransferase [Desulfovibrionaceae bacterium]|nr:site-specific DNA-methyltransferase [Desulfovibrionaceae bacterium]
MQKLDPDTDGKTMDIVADNIAKLKELFPDIVTEGKVDFETLKEVLGDYVEDREERYSFTWNGKSKARMLAQTPSNGTLRPCPEESVDFDSTQNLFIEGDNLEVLKLLQKGYYRKIKTIYIDPPYNTGKDFIYPDNFKDNLSNYLGITNQIDTEGRKISTNSEANGRYHTDWLNMLYPRLRLARNLLRPNGTIFISIDDHEMGNLKKLCDEIFGEENLFGVFQWRRRQRADNRNQTNVSPDHEYIVAYSMSELSVFKGTAIDSSKYKNPDHDPRGPWASIDLSGLATASQRPNLHYDIVDPETGNVFPPNPSRGWSKSKENVLRMIEEGRILFPKKSTGRPREKKFLKNIKSNVTGYSTWLDSSVVGFTTDGTREVTGLLGGKYFDFPKPSRLIKELLSQSTEGQDIVLDFFSGSATTAHAVIELNKSDDFNRRFILVQLPEACGETTEAFKAGYKTIADIGKDRIRKVRAKILEDETEYSGDLGFKVFKLDSTNIKPWEADFDNYESSLEDYISNIKPGRSEEDVLYEILLKYGLDPTLPIEERIIADKKVFIVGLGALVLCLADGITLDAVEGIADLKEELKPEVMRVVFKDNGFSGSDGDVVKANAVQILRQHDITDVKSL